MRLYTVIVDEKPVAVMSFGVALAPEEGIAKNPTLLAALRSQDALSDIMRFAAPDFDINEIGDHLEFEEALDSWLGDDLKSSARWDGDRERLLIRRSNTEEEVGWKQSYQAALAGDHIAGDQDWIIFLT